MKMERNGKKATGESLKEKKVEGRKGMRLEKAIHGKRNERKEVEERNGKE